MKWSGGDFISFKVAVASTDGENVNQDFGRSKQFLIFEIKDNGEYESLETRKNKPTCEIGEQKAMMSTLDLLADCKAVIVNHIGLGAVNLLLAKGIKPLVIQKSIGEALKDISSLLKE